MLILVLWIIFMILLVTGLYLIMWLILGSVNLAALAIFGSIGIAVVLIKFFQTKGYI